MPPVLVVQHEDDCPPALVGRWLGEQGVALDVRRPYLGEPLPASLADHGGMLVLGGPMGADDDAEHAWLAPTKALLRAAVSQGVATLGVCLGHQLLASALGGEVVRNPAGRQIGLLEVGWTPSAAGDPLLGSLATSRRGVHWNQDVVTRLPDGAIALAHAPGGELQVARFAPRAWGLQLHPEADADVVAAWAATADESTTATTDVAAVVATIAAADAELRAAWQPLAAAYARVLGEVAA